MTTQPERIPLDDLTSDALDALYARLDRAERIARSAARDAELALTARLVAEFSVDRVRQAVDAGPVGSCCAHLIHAALNPPTDLCGCGRPDPGPCQPCPTGSPSLHCACVCSPATKEPT